MKPSPLRAFLDRAFRQNEYVISEEKYQTRNPIERRIIANFFSDLLGLIESVEPQHIYEMGCGEGEISTLLAGRGFHVAASDYSSEAVAAAKGNAANKGLAIDFQVGDIYATKTLPFTPDVLVCCEVLEHLERPDEALENLTRLGSRYFLLSVPREPLWRILNFASGRYLLHFGNTPGHIQHWSASSFADTLSRYFDIIAVRNPLPWTMALCRARKT